MKRLALLLILAATARALPPVESLPRSRAIAEYNQWNHEAEHYGSIIGYTGSMVPYVAGGEWALCERPGSINVGDLVVFNRWDHANIMHEVVAINGNSFECKGRNCIKADGWYPNSRIKWVVRRVIRVKS